MVEWEAIDLKDYFAKVFYGTADCIPLLQRDRHQGEFSFVGN
jgi:hypothetical protein